MKTGIQGWMDAKTAGPSNERSDEAAFPWLLVHFGHCFLAGISYLAFYFVYWLLLEFFYGLHWLGIARFENTQFTFQLYDPWLKCMPYLFGAIVLGGWLFPLRAKNNPAVSLRRWEWFLLFGLWLRRIIQRPCRPARGTYWKHPKIRKRWLALLVKMHFLPLAFGSLFHAVENMDFILSQVFAQLRAVSWSAAWPLALILVPHLVYIIDGVVASCAYAIETRKHGRVREVESNPWSWLVCLACYPPTQLLTVLLLTQHAQEEHRLFAANSTLGMSCRTVALLFFVYYGYTSIVLGLRYSNLCYRGTTTWGPYAKVRHPQYSTKILGWFFEWLPFLVYWPNMISYLGWVGLYVARALTEERLLSKHADYREYKARVKWRILPGVW